VEKMNKKFSVFLMFVGSVLLYLPAMAKELSLSMPDTTIYLGGDIVTMEKDQPTAEAVVTDQSGRILFVGSKASALATYPTSNEFNLDGKTLMPGFIEQHLHPVLGALTLSIPVIAPEEWRLPHKTWPAVLGYNDYMKALSKVEESMGGNQDILWTWGYNQFFHGFISRSKLDGISTKRPIAVWHRSAHEFYLNSAMIAHLGITQEDINKAGPAIAKQIDLEKGHFYEGGFMVYLLPKVFPELANEQRMRQGLQQMVEMLHMRGVTAFSEPGAYIPPNAESIYLEVLGSDNTPMYSFFVPESKLPYYREGKNGVEKAVVDSTTIFPNKGKVRFMKGQVKVLLDGAIISQLMQMKDGYLDGHHGEWIQSPEEVEEITKIFWEKDYQIHVHVNGDLGVETLINIVKKRQDEYPREDHRFTIVHFANSTDEQVRQLKELGAIISINPYYVTGFGEAFSRVGLGKKRAESMVRSASIEKEGMHISLHSDMPMGPADPLYLAWSAATRHTLSGHVLRSDLALSRDAALRGITIEAAYSWQMEKILGSIKVGKIANFTILEENPYKVELDALKNIQVYGTVFEGKLFPVE